jgi:hypothetical protein
MKMKRKYDIKNLDELHAVVGSLKAQNDIQGQALIKDAKNYLQQFTPANLLKKYATPSNFMKADDKLNITSSLMSLVLPFVMNNTIFRGSGMITKALVGLASGKMGKSLDAEHLSNAFNSVKSWFKGFGKKKKAAPIVVDYGIPPDSETY